MKSITLQGPFTDEDVQELMQALRVCEQRQPEREFMMLVVDENDTTPVESLKEKLFAMFPKLKDAPVELRAAKR